MFDANFDIWRQLEHCEYDMNPHIKKFPKTFQALVGILFLVIGGFNINEEPKEKVADILNDIITILVFVITLVNVIISGFGMSFVEPLNSGIK